MNLKLKYSLILFASLICLIQSFKLNSSNESDSNLIKAKTYSIQTLKNLLDEPNLKVNKTRIKTHKIKGQLKGKVFKRQTESDQEEGQEEDEKQEVIQRPKSVNSSFMKEPQILRNAIKLEQHLKQSLESKTKEEQEKIQRMISDIQKVKNESIQKISEKVNKMKAKKAYETNLKVRNSIDYIENFLNSVKQKEEYTTSEENVPLKTSTTETQGESTETTLSPETTTQEVSSTTKLILETTTSQVFIPVTESTVVISTTEKIIDERLSNEEINPNEEVTTDPYEINEEFYITTPKPQLLNLLKENADLDKLLEKDLVNSTLVETSTEINMADTTSNVNVLAPETSTVSTETTTQEILLVEKIYIDLDNFSGTNNTIFEINEITSTESPNGIETTTETTTVLATIPVKLADEETTTVSTTIPVTLAAEESSTQITTTLPTTTILISNNSNETSSKEKIVLLGTRPASGKKANNNKFYEYEQDLEYESSNVLNSPESIQSEDTNQESTPNEDYLMTTQIMTLPLISLDTTTLPVFNIENLEQIQTESTTIVLESTTPENQSEETSTIKIASENLVTTTVLNENIEYVFESTESTSTVILPVENLQSNNGQNFFESTTIQTINEKQTEEVKVTESQIFETTLEQALINESYSTQVEEKEETTITSLEVVTESTTILQNNEEENQEPISVETITEREQEMTSEKIILETTTNFQLPVEEPVEFSTVTEFLDENQETTEIQVDNSESTTIPVEQITPEIFLVQNFESTTTASLETQEQETATVQLQAKNIEVTTLTIENPLEESKTSLAQIETTESISSVPEEINLKNEEISTTTLSMVIESTSTIAEEAKLETTSLEENDQNKIEVLSNKPESSTRVNLEENLENENQTKSHMIIMKEPQVLRNALKLEKYLKDSMKSKNKTEQDKIQRMLLDIEIVKNETIQKIKDKVNKMKAKKIYQTNSKVRNSIDFIENFLSAVIEEQNESINLNNSEKVQETSTLGSVVETNSQNSGESISGLSLKLPTKNKNSEEAFESTLEPITTIKPVNLSFESVIISTSTTYQTVRTQEQVFNEPSTLETILTSTSAPFPISIDSFVVLNQFNNTLLNQSILNSSLLNQLEQIKTKNSILAEEIKELSYELFSDQNNTSGSVVDIYSNSNKTAKKSNLNYPVFITNFFLQDRLKTKLQKSNQTSAIKTSLAVENSTSEEKSAISTSEKKKSGIVNLASKFIKRKNPFYKPNRIFQDEPISEDNSNTIKDFDLERRIANAYKYDPHKTYEMLEEKSKEKLQEEEEGLEDF